MFNLGLINEIHYSHSSHGVMVFRSYPTSDNPVHPCSRFEIDVYDLPTERHILGCHSPPDNTITVPGTVFLYWEIPVQNVRHIFSFSHSQNGVHLRYLELRVHRGHENGPHIPAQSRIRTQGSTNTPRFQLCNKSAFSFDRHWGW